MPIDQAKLTKALDNQEFWEQMYHACLEFAPYEQVVWANNCYENASADVRLANGENEFYEAVATEKGERVYEEWNTEEWGEIPF